MADSPIRQAFHRVRRIRLWYCLPKPRCFAERGVCGIATTLRAQTPNPRNETGVFSKIHSFFSLGAHCSASEINWFYHEHSDCIKSNGIRSTANLNLLRIADLQYIHGCGRSFLWKIQTKYVVCVNVELFEVFDPRSCG